MMSVVLVFVFNATATTESYTYGHTLSLPDALPISAPLAIDAAVDDPRKVEDLASKKSAAQEARKAHLLLQPHFLSPTPKCAPAALKSHQGRRFRLLRPLNWITTLSVWLSKKANLLLGRWRCRCGRDVVFKHF